MHEILGIGDEDEIKDEIIDGKLPSTDLSTCTVWAFNSPEMICNVAK